MAGILNNKERVLDFVVTQEGKRQAGSGELNIRYATFTDLHTFYETSGSLTEPKLTADASNRIFFETHNRYQDVIVPELEAGYSLRPFRTSDFDVVGGTIASGTLQVGFNQMLNVLTGSRLGPALSSVLDGITQNFTDQRIVGTIDEFSLYQNVVLSPTTGTFDINNSTKYLRGRKVNLDNCPSIFSDRRFADFANFKYLPPENAPRPGEDRGEPLGNYPRLNEKWGKTRPGEPWKTTLTLDDLMNSLKEKPMQRFDFAETSRDNNIVVQFFEQDTAGVEKLSVVDFGAFEDDDPISHGKRVLFVGKIQRDSFGAETFMCLFTVVID